MHKNYFTMSLILGVSLVTNGLCAAEGIERYTPLQQQGQAPQQIPAPAVTLPAPVKANMPKAVPVQPTYKKFDLNGTTKKKIKKGRKPVGAIIPKASESKSDDKKEPAPAKKETLPSMDEIRSFIENTRLASSEKTESKTLAAQIDESTQTVEKALKEQAKTVYSYYPGSIYTVWTREGLITDIWLQPNEEIISDILGGDTVRWIVQTGKSGSPEGDITHVSIRPMFPGMQTNIIINTNKHSYNLKVISTKNTYNPIISWAYPIEQRNTLLAVKKEQEKTKEDTITDEGISPEKINFHYTIKSNSGVFSSEYAWTPIKAFDDGIKSYIQVSKGMKTNESPALFVKDRKGELNLVNYRLKGEFYIVDRLFEEAELRNGIDEIVTIKKSN